VDLSGNMIYGLEHFGNVLCVDTLFRCNVHSEALSYCKKLAKSQFLFVTCPAGTEWPEQIYANGITCASVCYCTLAACSHISCRPHVQQL
jgi:hypothetical protein